MQKPTVLVTGSTGFLGLHLVAGLYEAGYDVIEYKKGTNIYDACSKADSLVFCAGELDNEDLMWQTNAELPQEFLAMLSIHKHRAEFDSDKYFSGNKSGKFIYIGSSAIFERSDPITNDYSPYNPVTRYECTKAAACKILRAQGLLNKMDVCVIHPSTLYGPGDKSPN